MRVNAWNVYSTVRENAKIVAATEHECDNVTEALNQAEDIAREWNSKEDRSDMLVTILTCGGYIRTIPIQTSLFCLRSKYSGPYWIMRRDTRQYVSVNGSNYAYTLSRDSATEFGRRKTAVAKFEALALDETTHCIVPSDID